MQITYMHLHDYRCIRVPQYYSGIYPLNSPMMLINVVIIVLHMRTEQSKPIFENFGLSQKEAYGRFEFRNKPTTSNAKKAVFLLCSTDLNVKMSHRPNSFHSSFINAWHRYGIFVFQSLIVNQWQKQGNNPDLLTPSLSLVQMKHMTLVFCPWNCILSLNNLHEMNWVCDFKYQSTAFPKLIDWIVLIVSFQSLLFFLYCPDKNGKQRPMCTRT